MLSEAEKQVRRSERLFVYVIVPQLVFLVLVIAFMYFFYGTASVAGDSMYPSLEHGDFVMVAKSYNSPVRGDVVVYDHDEDGSVIRVVKRVIAIAGDSVEVDEGRAFVNGKPESTDYEILTSARDTSIGEYVVPEGHVFVMGDNRPVSLDSRHYGAVSLDSMVGRAVFIAWPYGRQGAVDGSRP